MQKTGTKKKRTRQGTAGWEGDPLGIVQENKVLLVNMHILESVQENL